MASVIFISNSGFKKPYYVVEEVFDDSLIDMKQMHRSGVLFKTTLNVSVGDIVQACDARPVGSINNGKIMIG